MYEILTTQVGIPWRIGHSARLLRNMSKLTVSWDGVRHEWHKDFLRKGEIRRVLSVVNVNGAEYIRIETGLPQSMLVLRRHVIPVPNFTDIVPDPDDLDEGEQYVGELLDQGYTLAYYGQDDSRRASWISMLEMNLPEEFWVMFHSDKQATWLVPEHEPTTLSIAIQVLD